MNIQRTLIRYTRITKPNDERCAETLEEFQVEITSGIREKEATPARPARKEKKTTRSKNGKSRRKMKIPKMRKSFQKFWKLCSRHKKVLLAILVGIALCIRPDLKEILSDEKLIQILQLVLSLL